MDLAATATGDFPTIIQAQTDALRRPFLLARSLLRPFTVQR